jgi:hypothetical protein
VVTEDSSRHDDRSHAGPARKQAIKDLSEDAFGFGQVDLRTLRDLVLRPREVLEGWMSLGATANGRYARPLKLYLALSAVAMLILFLRGGMAFALEGLPSGALDGLIHSSGKSRDAFMADADGWMSLLLVPLSSLVQAVSIAPLMRWWDTERLGWTKGFRSTFAFLNAAAVLTLPFAWLSQGNGPLAGAAMIGSLAVTVTTFLRMGRGRWYQTALPGLAKGGVLLIVWILASTITSTMIIFIGIAAGLWA